MYRYFKEIERKVEVAYSIAQQARSKGLDPKSVVEISIARSLADRVVKLCQTIYPQLDEKIVKRIKELEQEYGFLDHAVCLKIAEEIAQEKFCKFSSFEQKLDAGIRVAFAYITLGIVSSPLEGYTHFRLKERKDGKQFISAYFSGPIRSAGGTAAAFSLIIIDHLREFFGLAPYDPTDQEIKRVATEIYDYHERITNLQYLPSKQEIEFLIQHLPIQINGEPSEQREVSNYKDLERIETNRIRDGVCLVIAEGLAQKAPKILKIVQKLQKKGFKLSQWSFLEEFVRIQKEQEVKGKQEKKSAVYIKDAVAGRPIFSHPGWPGSFRLRYGRTRLSGYSAIALSPATTILLDNFIATATQLKLEKPSKAAAVSACEEIEGPICKLKDGSVVKVQSKEQAEAIKEKVEEIIYLGDILIAYGDFFNRNHPLLPCGYNEEWWLAELKAKAVDYARPEKLIAETPAQLEDLEQILNQVPKINLEQAVKLSTLFNLPLHPSYIFYWSQINKDHFKALLEWLSKAKFNEKIELPYSASEKLKFKEGKRALELIGLPHKVGIDSVIIEHQDAQALLLNLGISKPTEALELKAEFEKNQKQVLEFVNEKARFEIRDKAGTFIGSRMGRPEKAKPRELKGSPNVLFPVGEQGGRLRSVQAALQKGFVEAEVPIYWCEHCQRESIYFICPWCGSKARQLYYCPKCSRNTFQAECTLHGKTQRFGKKKIPIKDYFEAAREKLKFSASELPPLVKGVRGTSSQDHVPENLVKGILRAKFGLNVNKDGTVRYDASELPITHFKPKEVHVSVQKLRELGYTKDVEGKELRSEEQLVELKPHDVILPCCELSGDEPASNFFFKVSKFVDEELERFYGTKPFYQLKSKEDLVGHLLLCIAPHNCASVVARIIGFSDTQAFLASPYLHAAMRRDADGDEAAMVLLLDALLNFSQAYLPAHRGGTQDAPLILNVRIRPAEVDDMVFDLDLERNYPLELYMAAQKGLPPSSIKLEQVSDRLKSEDEFAAFKKIYYTHEVENFNSAVNCSAYKTLPTIQEKLKHTMDLAKKIRAVDTADMARLVIERHFIRDIKGNFHKFSAQQFRCVQCNEKYKRPPLQGKCLRCGGRIIFTVAEGSVLKYLEAAEQLAKLYDVPHYTKQNLELLRAAIEGFFGKQPEKQQQLKAFLAETS